MGSDKVGARGLEARPLVFLLNFTMAVSGQSIGLETVKVSLVRLFFGSRRFVSGLEPKPLGFLGRLAYTEIDFAVVPRIPKDPETAYH